MTNLRIVKRSYRDGVTIRYIIQKKRLFWWVDCKKQEVGGVLVHSTYRSLAGARKGLGLFSDCKYKDEVVS